MAGRLIPSLTIFLGGGKTYDEQMKIYENVGEIAVQMDIIKHRAGNGEKRD